MGGHSSYRTPAGSARPAPAGNAIAGPRHAQLTQLKAILQRKPNRTGLPDRLKSGVEALSGVSMDQVRVHYNSAEPAQLNAHAYAQGTDIHLAPGQAHNLPHEAWHVAQQAQGRVQATTQLASGVPINDDTGLEREADVMGAQALATAPQETEEEPAQLSAIDGPGTTPVQRLLDEEGGVVDVTTLGDDELFALVNAIHLGEEPEGYMLQPGDGDLIFAEYRRRQDGVPLRITEDDVNSDMEEEDEDYQFDNRDEFEVHMTTTARDNAGLDKIKYRDGEEREIRNWSEKSFQGTMGEYFASQTMSNQGYQPIALNGGQFGLNFPGGDHLFSSGGGGFMEQTKLHLSGHTASTSTYLKHVQNAQDYAIKAIKGFHKKLDVMQDLANKPPFSANQSFCDFVDALGKLEGTGDDDIDGSEAHTLLVEGTRFSIPGDIYDQMPNNMRHHFIRMDQTVADFTGLKEDFEDDFVRAKQRNTDEDDEDYVN
ncbi:DUF4157 domain-containing protein [Sphingomonas sp. QA11]|uniref:eCIS core domain-containing protein n=1 Tax=Sphingomonas sp. QA11 TaxID=2950605 RepID=UPI00234B4F4F|nr:DUF4157 domain-containing protein [Sphingomonas sp. QA11]WCM26733.1 DUF4157 domain-containing protein [Sphingomonas sp. QA11]